MKFIKDRLRIMMLLQYAVWGIWLPVLATYLQSPIADGGLGFTSGQVGWILGLAGSVGAVSAPFIAGQLAGKNAKAMDFSGSRKLDEELKRIFWVNDTRLVAVVEIPSKRWGTAVIETRPTF